MKRKLSMLVALVLALAVCVSMAGCGDEPMSDNVIKGTLKGSLVAEKIGQVDTDEFDAYRGGLIYRDKETKLYGVLSLEGKHDTGAIFARCSDNGLYFTVRTTEPSSAASMAEINSAALINGKGQTLIPYEYAYYYVLNDRYVKAYKATERTSISTDALLFLSDNNNIQLTTLGDTLAWYEGEWVIYDLEKKRTVPGLGGTTDDTIVEHGDFLTYSIDDKYYTVDGDGQPAPEGSDVFNDGSYALNGEVFTSEGELLFTYDKEGFTPSYVCTDTEYYVATKYEEGVSTYVLMDKKGEIVSAEFPDTISVYGDVLYCEEKLYTFEGRQIIDGVYSNMKFDNIFGKNYLLYQDDTYRLINPDGSAIFTFKEKQAQVFSSDFTATKEKDDENYVYCYKDEDFTIKGYTFAPWLAKAEGVEDRYNIVDTISGKTLLEGYEDYDYSTFDGTRLYVYAYFNGGADIFIVINEEDLAAVRQKKADLLADLTAAFKAEGITININEETGEMGLDTSVLFGGDSAVLTADGKAFLNKFIKVYNNIAFSDKYAGFISKTLVEGHIAPVSGSTFDSGYPLSIERATNVLNYCLSKDSGVNLGAFAADFEPVGYSNTQPIYNDDGSVNMAASRRVSFRFMVSLEMI